MQPEKGSPYGCTVQVSLPLVIVCKPQITELINFRISDNFLNRVLILVLQLFPCSDTVSRSGMYCAISNALQQCKAEDVVDVFQSVKRVRMQKPGAVTTQVHKCVVHKSFNI